MIGVVVLPAQDGVAYGLGEHRPLPLLPLGDRPILQHMIELLVHQGLRRFELILEQVPEQVEHYLGDGTRWGCKFQYHLVSQSGRPYRLLNIIPAIENEPWLLAHADQLPYIPFSEHFGDTRPVVFIDGQSGGWSGAALFPPGNLKDAELGGSRESLDAYVETLVASGAAKTVPVSQNISVKTPAALLQSQRDLLDRTFADLMIGGNENEPGVWISRNVVIHPSAEVHAPVYLGPNCRLGKGARIGPHAVISGNCIVDAHTLIQNSLITSGSYVGEHLEVCDAIVSRNLLVNTRLDTALTIHESFLLGNLAGSPQRSGLVQTCEALLAILLILLFSPLLLIGSIYLAVFRRGALASADVVELPSEDNPQIWRTYGMPFAAVAPWAEHPAAGWRSFFCRFLPGLFAVARGKLSLVGLPVRTKDEILELPQDWRSLYLSGKAGLISEAVLSEPGALEDSFLTDAYYCATHGFRHDLNLFVQYFLGLLATRHVDVSTGETGEKSATLLTDSEK